MKRQDSDTPVFAEDLVKTVSTEARAIAPGEIVIGVVTDIDPQGQPSVNYPDNPSAHALTAISTLGITAAHIGREVALLFANGDPQRPVIMGLIHNAQSALHDLILSYDGKNDKDIGHGETKGAPSSSTTNDINIDGKKIIFEGKEEVVLRCGDASITLTKSGKILIRGKYLVNRSSGVNRILGGSVQIN